ncbi:MAG TPA: alpha/beta fold hydrolase [Chloroflexota bacterium]|nr:alpha/beta fold hydrolase [Chloroflexota bacterium]
MRFLLTVCTVLVLVGCRVPQPAALPPPPKEGFITGEGGVRLFYRTVGSGRDTVVVLHGSPGFHMNYLLPDLVPLARGRTLLFYDQRGGGRSELIRDPDRLTVEHHVRDLEALRRHFGLQRLSLLGHSWGGGLAALYALEHPTRVERMLLLAPMTPRRDPYLTQSTEAFLPRLDSATWARLRTLDQSLATSDDPVATCRELMQGLMDAPLYFADTAAARRFQGDFCDAPPEALRMVPKAREAFNRSRGAWDLRAELKTLRVPALVVHGERDAIPLEASREWASSLPNARLLVVPGADHYLFAEKPEQVIPAADQFFQGKWPQNAQLIPRQDAP